MTTFSMGYQGGVAAALPGSSTSVDNLASTSATAALSANQGRLLALQITNLADPVLYTVTPTNGQTVFVVPGITDPHSVTMRVNSVPYAVADAITVNGTTVTWVGDFAIAATDIVAFQFK